MGISDQEEQTTQAPADRQGISQYETESGVEGIAAATSGRTVITDRALSDIVGLTVLECYGVVGMASPSLRRGVAALLSRDRLHQGIKVEQEADALRIRLYIIVEHGLNVAEVAGNVRSQVMYNVEKMVGRPVTALEIYVQGVRASGR